jgi:hypothetical protein
MLVRLWLGRLFVGRTVFGDLFAAAEHFAAEVWVQQLAARLQPVASPAWDHRTEEVREGLVSARTAHLRSKRDDGMANWLKRLSRGIQLHVMEVFGPFSDLAK